MTIKIVHPPTNIHGRNSVSPSRHSFFFWSLPFQNLGLKVAPLSPPAESRGEGDIVDHGVVFRFFHSIYTFLFRALMRTRVFSFLYKVLMRTEVFRVFLFLFFISKFLWGPEFELDFLVTEFLQFSGAFVFFFSKIS